jgi:hypothetical protein
MSGALIKHMRLLVESMVEIPDGPPYFYIGHRKDVNNQFNIKNRRSTGNKKYPAVVLPLDVSPKVEDGFYKFSCSIWLFALSKDVYTTEDRLNQVFIPTLHPLYFKLMDALKQSNVFLWQGDQTMPPHEPTDRYYIGSMTSEGNKAKFFDDPLDAIEIRNLELNIPIRSCLP